MAEITLLRPKIWQKSNHITAAVTASNEDVITGGALPGLNMSVKLEGNSDRVNRYRRLVLESLSLRKAGIALGVQVHSSDITVVSEPGTYPQTDGLITQARNLCLGILIADCAAVLLADRKNNIIAALHAGWRGAISNIVPDAIERMQQLGAETKHIEAYISPCISQVHFEVGEEVAIQFPETFVDRTSYAKPHIDLRGFIVHQLTSTGVPEKAVTSDTRCTFADSSLYSYRRQKQQSGRMMALICQS